ncbi:MAG: GSCFA domain-containing protein [Prolixibacteraceae bacterium]|nr:GSCFA domain-containing protein [Prolixibacteraceae bacterium]
MNSKFHTAVEIPGFNWQTGYRNKNIFLGSCFTEHIGGKMNEYKYPADINPFGILYNPLSISNGLKILLKKKIFSKDDLIHQNGLWHSFSHHSRFSSPDANHTLANINQRIESSAQFLKSANFLFLTFGTAWIYEYRITGTVVSNCHKIPDKEFKRFRLTPSEIIDEYKSLLPEIWKLNPGLKIVFTISPVRHWKDGAIENQRSKATLLLAAEIIIKGFETDKCNYFPAYEIMMDELRDYRFYEEDMIHLSTSAINHIWSIFENTLIDQESRELSKKIKKIRDAMNHKPFNRFTKEHLHFLKQCLLRTKMLQVKFPYLNMSGEENFFLSQITGIEDFIKR